MWSIICSKGANLTSIRSYLTILVSWWSAHDMVHHYSDQSHEELWPGTLLLVIGHFTETQLSDIFREFVMCKLKYLMWQRNIHKTNYWNIWISTFSRHNIHTWQKRIWIPCLESFTLDYNMKILGREIFVGCGEFCCPSNGPSVARGSIKLRLLFEVQIFA